MYFPEQCQYWRRSLRWSNYWPFQANHINDGMFIEDLVTWCRLLHYNVIKENSDLRNNSCRPYFIVIQIWVGIIFMRFSEGLNLMNIMPTHIWITIKYGGMNYFDSNRTNMVILKFEAVKVINLLRNFKNGKIGNKEMDSEIVVETVA